MASPHDHPDPRELVGAVRELFLDDVIDLLSGRVRFHVRVAINVLRIVERELALGPGHAEEQQARLDRLGCRDETELVERIRSGQLDDRYDEVSLRVREMVWDKVSVANPDYLLPYDAPSTAREH
jgi:hypothetical protein